MAEELFETSLTVVKKCINISHPREFDQARKMLTRRKNGVILT